MARLFSHLSKDVALSADLFREWRKSAKRRVSLVDHMSFLMMKLRNVETAFAFDPDFKTHGFRLFEL